MIPPMVCIRHCLIYICLIFLSLSYFFNLSHTQSLMNILCVPCLEMMNDALMCVHLFTPVKWYTLHQINLFICNYCCYHHNSATDWWCVSANANARHIIIQLCFEDDWTILIHQFDSTDWQVHVFECEKFTLWIRNLRRLVAFLGEGCSCDKWFIFFYSTAAVFLHFIRHQNEHWTWSHEHTPKFVQFLYSTNHCRVYEQHRWFMSADNGSFYSHTLWPLSVGILHRSYF